MTDQQADDVLRKARQIVNAVLAAKSAVEDDDSVVAMIGEMVSRQSQEQTMKPIVHGYDAEFWHHSYTLLRDAVIEHLGEFVQDDDVAEEAILIEAIKKAGAASLSHQLEPYTYGDQLLRRCEPGTRKGHFFLEGASQCQCGSVGAPIAPVVVNSQQEPPKEPAL